MKQAEGCEFGFMKGCRDMRCVLHLPAPLESMLHASVSLSSDSTYRRFKGIFCDTAGAEGYHVQDVRIMAGAEEAEVAQEALTFSRATVAVHIQNGK